MTFFLGGGGRRGKNTSNALMLSISCYKNRDLHMASSKITEYFLVLNFWKGKDLRGIIQITRFKGKYFHPIICNLFKRCQVPRCGHLGKQLGSRAHLVIFLPFTATWVLITRYLRNNNNYNISVGFFAFCYDFFKINHILFTQLRGHFKLHRISVMSLSLRIRQGFCHMPLTYIVLL